MHSAPASPRSMTPICATLRRLPFLTFTSRKVTESFLPTTNHRSKISFIQLFLMQPCFRPNQVRKNESDSFTLCGSLAVDCGAALAHFFHPIKFVYFYDAAVYRMAIFASRFSPCRPLHRRSTPLQFCANGALYAVANFRTRPHQSGRL